MDYYLVFLFCTPSNTSVFMPILVLSFPDTVLLAHTAVACWGYRLWWATEFLKNVFTHPISRLTRLTLRSLLQQSIWRKGTYVRKESWSCTSRWGRERERAQEKLILLAVIHWGVILSVLRSSITAFTSGWIINGISLWCRRKSSTGWLCKKLGGVARF